MRDEDLDQQEEDDIPVGEDLDFETISGGKPRSLGKDRTSSDSEANEESTRLHDRVIPTVGVESITTKSEKVSGSTLSNHSRVAVDRVGSAHGVVTINSHSVTQQIELNTVSQGDEDASDSEEQTLPNHIRTVGTTAHVESLRHQVTNPLYLREETATHVETLGTTQLKTLTTDNRSTSNIMTLNQSQTGNRPEQEAEEFDPAYHWTGGNPYGSTIPQCIIHINSSDAESLPFLQRVLRDTYTELEGGRPRTKTATVRAGSIENTTIHGAIVTLDLTTEAWTVSTEDQQIRINHGDRDMIPDLKSIISTLYAGKLGYFVLNIDAEDLQSRFIPDETQELIRTLLPTTEDYDSDQTSNELLQRTAAPIRLASPRQDSSSEFIEVAKRYFSFEHIDHSRIADIEAEHEARLRANDWRRIALTQQQEASEGESDEHYLWKAAMTAGIAWQMYEEYSVLEEEISFNKFVEKHLMSSGPIHSETSDESTDEVPDIEINTGRTWAWNGVRHYLSATNPEPPKNSRVVFEFETGRAEGAFNFRKFYHTLDKYSEESEVWIYLVVPPRTLFRSELRAEMIHQLVERWTSSSESDQRAELCVPVLGQYGCEKLISAQSLLAEWFGDKDE
ncbi:hypothetical protein [Haloplanus salilacus]|uniref:hypothetical protein n=1 Tax=Haloplanus salilacus TaxID=2949994 RepID=UPI0030CED108